MTIKKVYVLRRGDQYWWDCDHACWGPLEGRYTKVWKTRRGAERFRERNPEVGKVTTVEEVSENAPRANWR